MKTTSQQRLEKDLISKMSMRSKEEHPAFRPYYFNVNGSVPDWLKGNEDWFMRYAAMHYMNALTKHLMEMSYGGLVSTLKQALAEPRESFDSCWFLSFSDFPCENDFYLPLLEQELKFRGLPRDSE